MWPAKCSTEVFTTEAQRHRGSEDNWEELKTKNISRNKRGYSQNSPWFFSVSLCLCGENAVYNLRIQKLDGHTRSPSAVGTKRRLDCGIWR